MNVLFITYDFPYPMNSGGKNRAYHMIKHTASKANIYLYSFVRDDYNPESNEEILKLGVKEIKVFKRRKLKSLSLLPKIVLTKSSIFKSLYFTPDVVKDLKNLIKEKKIDVVHYESSYTGYFINALKGIRVKQVLGTENIEFMLYEDYAKSMKLISPKFLITLQSKRLKSEELDMVKNSDKVTVITKAEADILEELTGVKSEIVANGIETSVYDYKFDRKVKNNILFVGNFTYFPNVDAMNFFYKHVFETLRRDITVTIVGKKCNEKLAFSDPRIIKKDFVEHIIEEYRNADVLIFPIRIGGGTNFKVLEAMSLGVPIVANPDRLSGLKAVDGAHFLSASKGSEYAEKINMLYEDPELRENIARNARELVQENFEWKGIGEDLLKVWKNTL